MKNIIFLIFLLLLSFYSLGQADCFTPNIPINKDASAPYCGTLSSYRPDNPNVIPKYIRVNFHIMQKTDGTGNFQANDPQHMAYLNAIIPYIVDSKIQLILKGIYFHQDDVGWVNNHSIYSSYNYDNYKVNDGTELNIFFTQMLPTDNGYQGGIGNGLNGESTNYIVTDGWFDDYLQNLPGTYGPNHLGGTPWIRNPHLLHEIGHCLNLLHTYDVAQFSDTYWPQLSTWCNPANDFHCTNNVMSYSSTKTFLSPMQLEFLHKELIFSWRKKLVANCDVPINYPIVVTQNENWDYAISTANVLTINNAAAVDVSCKFTMIENSTITVNQLSTLNFNSAQISTCKNCSKITYNIDGTLNFNNTPFIMSPNSILNISSTGVVNINNADGLCINQGGQINIATGGKIYINGQDYTNIFVNGYNNIYDKSFVNQPILGGTYYAFNRIETSGTVNTLTNQTTELIAGRQIVFKPGFTGYAGLHASIDSKVNNCIETPCGSGMRMANTTYNNANSVGVYDPIIISSYFPTPTMVNLL